jgi:hypothetical protein
MNSIVIPSKSTTEKDVEVIVEADGSIVFVHDDDLHELLSPLFDLQIHRASYIEPGGRDGRSGWTIDVSPFINLIIFLNRKPPDFGRVAIPEDLGLSSEGWIIDRRDKALELEKEWLSQQLETIDLRISNPIRSSGAAASVAAT